jgi:hypothetical protein
MPYRLRYDIEVDWTPGGVGLGMGAPLIAGTFASAAGGGGLTYYFTNVNANPSSNTFTNSDIANLLAAMVADLTTQLEAVTTQTNIQNSGVFSAVPPPGGG